MPHAKKARAIGFNHVALEVGDIDEALAFYGRLFEFELRSRSKTSAFIDLGDQFLALQKGRTQPADDGRHFGLVVDDKEAVRQALAEAGVETLPSQFLDFLDPWGNRIEIVSYDNVQFTMALSLILGEAKLAAEHMETTAEVTLEKVADGFAITAVHLTLKGKVPGANQAKFEELAGKAKAGCPVSKLLNAKITLDATLVN